MDLEQFVTTTLVQLIRGVESADRELGEGDGAAARRTFVAPRGLGRNVSDPSQPVSYDPSTGHVRGHVSLVRFDVAVSAGESQGASKGATIKVLDIVNLGAKGREETTNSTVSRVQFEVPIVFGAKVRPDGMVI